MDQSCRFCSIVKELKQYVKDLEKEKKKLKKENDQLKKILEEKASQLNQ